MSGVGFALALAAWNVSAAPASSCSQGVSYQLAQSGGASKSAVIREWKGLSGGVTKAADRVIRTPAEWTAMWRESHSNQVPPPAAPRVDFDREMVLAVFMGERPTGGHAITIEDVAFGDKEIRVTVWEQSPPPDALTTQAFTQPFHIVVVKKSALPVKFVRTAKQARLPSGVPWNWCGTVLGL
jgi:hypothetical protein